MITDDDTFEMVCFRAARMFLTELADQGCARYVRCFSPPEMAEAGDVGPGYVVKVTVEFAPESEVEA